MILRELAESDEAAFLEAVRDYDGILESDEAAFLEAVRDYDGILDWLTFHWKPGMPFAEHLERLRKNARGEDLDGRVPDTMLYGFVEGRIVGRVSLRHELNECLLDRGGHVGYSVAPRYRRLGYASEMLRLCLPFCRKVGLSRILMTCDDENVASWKILETAGARLEDTRSDASGKRYRRYWLDL